MLLSVAEMPRKFYGVGLLKVSLAFPNFCVYPFSVVRIGVSLSTSRRSPQMLRREGGEAIMDGLEVRHLEALQVPLSDHDR